MSLLTIAKEENLKEVNGVYVTGVVADGAAKAAGIRGEGCHHCHSTVNRLRQLSDLQEKVSRYRPGDKVEVTYLRNGKQDKKAVVLTQYSRAVPAL
ncbi:MAG: PDZ domain-containing protein [Marinilabiliales bacterium]|nr:PDZ domain-containing protein [Marinilabiliales bacterium]